jgi:hypothetical protein
MKIGVEFRAAPTYEEGLPTAFEGYGSTAPSIAASLSGSSSSELMRDIALVISLWPIYRAILPR